LEKGGGCVNSSLGAGSSLRKNRAMSSPPDAPVRLPPPVHRVALWQRVVLEPLGLLMRLWGRSLRFETTPSALRQLCKRDEPVAMVLWHNRLFLAAEIFRRFRHGRPVYALVSASKDGAWLEAFFELAGLRTIRGSSSTRGREAALLLVDVLRAGYDIGITPDGPRGPRYEVKGGGLVVARRAQVPILLLGGVFESAWRLGSWDGFCVPTPFSRVRVTGEVIPVEALADRDAALAHVAARLHAINRDTAWEPTPVVL
jgi:lysophospholipid acyltransferase (LPLAT)-like uncharacterized protein